MGIMTQVEKVFESLSFYIQDLVLPLAGYYKNFPEEARDSLTVATKDADIIASASMDDWMYVNPVSIYPDMYERIIGLLYIDVPPPQSNFISSATIVEGDNGSSHIVACDYRYGKVLCSGSPIQPVRASYGAKTVKVVTTSPDSPQQITPPQIALLYDATTRSGGAIGRAAKFVTDHFLFDVWGRNDLEVMRLGAILEQALRISIPIINFEATGFPLGPNLSGKGMEPRLTFDPVNFTEGWAQLSVANFQKLDFPASVGADRYRGTGRIELVTVR